MRIRTCAATAVFELALVVGRTRPAAGAEPKPTVEQIRKELMQLSDDGASISWRSATTKGTATLMGYVRLNEIVLGQRVISADTTPRLGRLLAGQAS